MERALLRDKDDPKWNPLPELGAQIVVTWALNQTLGSAYTVEQVAAMDDEYLLMLREGVDVWANFVAWERKKAKREAGLK